MDMDSIIQSFYALPQWVQWWVVVLFAMNALSIVFLRHASGRLVFVFWLIMTALGAWMVMQAGGLTRALAFVHFLWVPMIIWLGRAPGDPGSTRLVRSWLVLLVLVNCISLGFDVVEIVHWLAGDQGVIGAA